MSFLTPLAVLAGLIAIPIILMYMLRLRRREILVSSTFLWQQILEDREANTPWQRLRRNILLFLQLVILALMVLALVRPYVTVPTVSSGQTALLIDASASMNAADVDGRTRFEAAKDEARDIISRMGDNDAMTVIRVANVPEVLTPYTGNKNELRAAVNGASPGVSTADWVAALTLASSGGGAEDFNIVIISDGGIGDASNIPPIPGEKRYIQVGESSSNLAITALATRALPDEAPQLFAQVTNYSDMDTEVSLLLSIDGVQTESQRIAIPAQSRTPFYGQLPLDFTTVQAELVLPDIDDYLEGDDKAWAVSTITGSRRALLMTPGNLFVEQVLRSLPGLETFKGNIDSGLPAREYDLYIFDSWLPGALPTGDMLFINPPESTSLFTIGEMNQDTDNIVVQEDDPRMNFVDFGNVNILRLREVSAEWADTLIRADGGPLLLAGQPSSGRQVAVMTFAVQESDLPLQVAWPVMMANLLEWFSPRDIISAPDGLRVGDSLLIRPPFEADIVRVTLPDETVRELSVGEEPLIFTDNDLPGIYTIEVLLGDEVLQSQPFAVNLFDEGESNIEPVTGDLQLGDAAASTGEREELGQEEYWPYIAALALLVLVIEWYVYHRRLRVPTVMAPVVRARNIG